MKHEELGWAYGVLYQDLGMCGCGRYKEKLEILKFTLSVMPLYPPKLNIEYLDTALGEWFLDSLDKGNLIEHGSSIRNSWLTSKGKRFLKCLESLDTFIDYMDNMGLCTCNVCKKEFDKKE